MVEWPKHVGKYDLNKEHAESTPGARNMLHCAGSAKVRSVHKTDQVAYVTSVHTLHSQHSTIHTFTLNSTLMYILLLAAEQGLLVHSVHLGYSCTTLCVILKKLCGLHQELGGIHKIFRGVHK